MEENYLELRVINLLKYRLNRFARALSILLFPLLFMVFIVNRFGKPSFSELFEWPTYVRWIGVALFIFDIPVILYFLKNRMGNHRFIILEKEIKLKTDKKVILLGHSETTVILMEREWNSPIKELYSVVFQEGEKVSRKFFVIIDSPSIVDLIKTNFHVVGQVW